MCTNDKFRLKNVIRNTFKAEFLLKFTEIRT